MKRGFSQREKREHYNGIVKGKVPIKGDSIFSQSEQIAYARGQADARNEGARIFAYKRATPAERTVYCQKQAEKRALYKARKRAASRFARKKMAENELQYLSLPAGELYDDFI